MNNSNNLKKEDSKIEVRSHSRFWSYLLAIALVIIYIIYKKA
jgi:hypothetical protein